jgi:hypothetical protein
MRSLTDYKNRVRAERAVTDWLTGDSVNWRSLSRGNASREDAPPAATPHFGTALSLNGSWVVPRHLIDDLYFNLPGPSAVQTGHNSSSDSLQVQFREINAVEPNLPALGRPLGSHY